MKYLTKDIEKLLGIKEEHYKAWCKKHQLLMNDNETKRKFFDLILKDQLKLDIHTNKLVEIKNINEA